MFYKNISNGSTFNKVNNFNKGSTFNKARALANVLLTSVIALPITTIITTNEVIASNNNTNTNAMKEIVDECFKTNINAKANLLNNNSYWAKKAIEDKDNKWSSSIENLKKIFERAMNDSKNVNAIPDEDFVEKFQKICKDNYEKNHTLIDEDNEKLLFSYMNYYMIYDTLWWIFYNNKEPKEIKNLSKEELTKQFCNSAVNLKRVLQRTDEENNGNLNVYEDGVSNLFESNDKYSKYKIDESIRKYTTEHKQDFDGLDIGGFQNEAELKLLSFLKHDWDCYLTQFGVICDIKNKNGNDIKSVVGNVRKIYANRKKEKEAESVLNKVLEKSPNFEVLTKEENQNNSEVRQNNSNNQENSPIIKKTPMKTVISTKLKKKLKELGNISTSFSSKQTVINKKNREGADDINSINASGDLARDEKKIKNIIKNIGVQTCQLIFDAFGVEGMPSFEDTSTFSKDVLTIFDIIHEILYGEFVEECKDLAQTTSIDINEILPALKIVCTNCQKTKVDYTVKRLSKQNIQLTSNEYGDFCKCAVIYITGSTTATYDYSDKMLAYAVEYFKKLAPNLKEIANNLDKIFKNEYIKSKSQIKSIKLQKTHVILPEGEFFFHEDFILSNDLVRKTHVTKGVYDKIQNSFVSEATNNQYTIDDKELSKLFDDAYKKKVNPKYIQLNEDKTDFLSDNWIYHSIKRLLMKRNIDQNLTLYQYLQLIIAVCFTVHSEQARLVTDDGCHFIDKNLKSECELYVMLPKIISEDLFVDLMSLINTEFEKQENEKLFTQLLNTSLDGSIISESDKDKIDKLEDLFDKDFAFSKNSVPDKHNKNENSVRIDESKKYSKKYFVFE